MFLSLEFSEQIEIAMKRIIKIINEKNNLKISIINRKKNYIIFCNNENNKIIGIFEENNLINIIKLESLK